MDYYGIFGGRISTGLGKYVQIKKRTTFICGRIRQAHSATRPEQLLIYSPAPVGTGRFGWNSDCHNSARDPERTRVSALGKENSQRYQRWGWCTVCVFYLPLHSSLAESGASTCWLQLPPAAAGRSQTLFGWIGHIQIERGQAWRVHYPTPDNFNFSKWSHEGGCQLDTSAGGFFPPTVARNCTYVCMYNRMDV